MTPWMIQHRRRRGAAPKDKLFTEFEPMRRRMLMSLLLMMATVPMVGCALPIYSALPGRRAEQLIFTSENLRAMIQEWERFWFMDQPDHMSPYRTHGGVI
jgi:hypothetical protein